MRRIVLQPGEVFDNAHLQRKSAFNAKALAIEAGRTLLVEREKVVALAEANGIPQSIVDTAVDSLAIEDWQVVSLPEDATETGSYSVDTDDMSARITTYDDPSIVTVEAYGQTLTMEVPQSARGYITLLGYLEGA